MNRMERAKSQELRAAVRARRLPPAYTLIELLIVMGIILLMTTLALVSVNAMLRAARMSRCLNLIVAATDEARTAAIAARRSARLDLTRLDQEGGVNRLTVTGLLVNEGFDSYTTGATTELTNQWLYAGPQPEVIQDAPPYLKMGSPGIASTVVASTKTAALASGGGAGGPAYYWRSHLRTGLRNEDYEVLILGRVKVMPAENQFGARSIALLGCVDDGGSTLGGAGVTAAYRLKLAITPFGTAANAGSTVSLDRIGGAISSSGVTSSGPSAVDVDVAGAPSTTTVLADGVWYRVMLSIKTRTEPGGATRADIAGKVWGDGELEPATWTVGPVTDAAPLQNGSAGFEVDHCAAAAGDFLFDVRPIRALPPGLRIDSMDPTYSPTGANDPGRVATADSGLNFPLLFRPDGTTQNAILRLTDVTSGDRRYVVVYSDTGRSRIVDTLTEALKQ